ncbi:hypothetical protein F2Q69_00007946 [Brassica cretica]|uniref:Uncharacterized protein n=1 Tax=Brassica cretica TaxID=69181 RepID=A0A8S9NTS6_BRACR|nr:hypothetical protein F2Q69_00007946 [Brassica cretica]
MTHPYEEMTEMKKLKKHYDMLGFVADVQYGIPTCCPCGGEIMTNVSPASKYKSDFDTLPGSETVLYSGYLWVKLCYTLGRWVALSSAMGFWCSARSGSPKGGGERVGREIAKLKRLITSTSRP